MNSSEMVTKEIVGQKSIFSNYAILVFTNFLDRRDQCHLVSIHVSNLERQEYRHCSDIYFSFE